MTQPLEEAPQYGWRFLLEAYIDNECLYFGESDDCLPRLLAHHCTNVNVLDYVSDAGKKTSGRVNQLPFETDSVDTIVVSKPVVNSWITANKFKRAVNWFQELLPETGSLILVCPGWPTVLGLVGEFNTGSAQASTSVPAKLGGATRANPWAYKKASSEGGFPTVELFTTIPISHGTSTYDITDTDTVKTILQSGRDGPAKTLLKKSLKLADKANVLQHCYPEYILACSNKPPADVAVSLTGFVRHGTARTILLKKEGGKLKQIRKYPNRPADEAITQHESAILKTIHETCQPSLRDVIPTGRLEESQFGDIGVEQPVPGSPLDMHISKTINSFRTVIRMGLNWIQRFQSDCSTAQYDSQPNLDIDKLDCDFPESLFQVKGTIVHGDYNPQNILVADRTVSGVIDWEYSSEGGNRLIDPTFFTLQVGRVLFGDVRRGFHELYLNNSEFNTVLKKAVRGYCDRTGLSEELFLTAVPIGMIHQLNMDVERDSLCVDDPKAEEKIADIEYIANHRSETLEQWETAVSTTYS